jgi:hypothetical protein
MWNYFLCINDSDRNSDIDNDNLYGTNFYVDLVSKWTQFDDDDVSMIVKEIIFNDSDL